MSIQASVGLPNSNTNTNSSPNRNHTENGNGSELGLPFFGMKSDQCISLAVETVIVLPIPRTPNLQWPTARGPPTVSRLA